MFKNINSPQGTPYRRVPPALSHQRSDYKTTKQLSTPRHNGHACANRLIVEQLGASMLLLLLANLFVWF